MKKGCGTIFLIIGGIIVLGVLLRIGQYYMMRDSQSESIFKKKNYGTQAYADELKIKNLYGKPLIDGGTILPITEWADIVPGKWDLLLVADGEKSFGVWKGEFQFSDKKVQQIDVFCKGNFYSKDTTHPPESENDAFMKVGGGLQGTWTIASDTGLRWNFAQCNVRITNNVSGNKNYDPCLYLKELAGIGNYQELGVKYHVKAFNQDTIFAVREDFKNNSTSYFYFIRIK